MLAAHAHVLAMAWRHQEAQQVGLDALALADQLARPDIASEVITTLSALRLGTTKERLREALREAIDRTVEAGAVHAELRGRYLLARSYQDWGELDEAERWFGSAVERARGERHRVGPLRLGCPLAPHLGPPDPRRLGRRAQADRPLGRATRRPWRAPTSRRCAPWSASPAARTSPTSCAACGRCGGSTARSPCTPLPRRCSWRSARRDVAAAQASYDHVVQVIDDIWHPWFDGRVRMAALVLEAIAAALPQTSAADRGPLLEAAERLHDDGHTVVDRYADPATSWGPEGRAWLARLDAELLRVRWLAGADDAPSLEALVTGWREVVALFDDFGDVYELARAQVVLASVLRTRRRPCRGSRGRRRGA